MACFSSLALLSESDGLQRLPLLPYYTHGSFVASLNKHICRDVFIPGRSSSSSLKTLGLNTGRLMKSKEIFLTSGR